MIDKTLNKDVTVGKDDFLFYLPVELDKSGKEWKIRGLASTADIDDQNEVVAQDGLDIAHLRNGLGLFNYDHAKGPENIIGQITNANKSDQGLFVEGYLFDQQPKAQAIKNIMGSLNKGNERRVKMSIEGKVLKRKGNKILRAKVHNVALTMNPVNTNTYAEFMKSFATKEDVSPGEEVNSSSVSQNDEPEVTSSASGSLINIDKAKLAILVNLAKAGISTGNYNVPPSNRTQGAALQTESLDETKLRKLRKKYKKSHIAQIAKMVNKSYPDIDAKDCANIAFKVYEKKIINKLEKLGKML